MHFAGDCRNFIGRQIDFIGGSRCLTSSGGEVIGNGTDHGVLDRHRWLQRLGGIKLRGSVHHLRPDRQGEGRAVAARYDRDRLIEADPHAASERVSVTHEPRVLVIVGRTGFASGGQVEA